MNEELVALEQLMDEHCFNCRTDICATKRNGACHHFKNYKIVERAVKEKNYYKQRVRYLETMCQKHNKRYRKLSVENHTAYEVLRIIREYKLLEHIFKNPYYAKKYNMSKYEINVLWSGIYE